MTSKTYILFTESELWWARLFTTRGFGHCDVVLETDDEYELFRFCRRGLKQSTYNKNDESWHRIITTNKLIPVNDALKNARKRSFLGPRFFSCVTMCKYTLGIDSHAQTPYQLYNFLVEHLS